MGYSQRSLQEIWDTQLSDWITSHRLSNAASKAFEIQESSPALRRLIDVLRDPHSTEAPQLAQLSSDHLKNHLGAFSWETNTIYTDPRLSSSPSLASLVLAHELGHWIERQVNGGNTSHKAVQAFALDILGLPHRNDLFPSKPGNAHGNDGEEITLANGGRVSVRFFDTSIHTGWIKGNLPFFNTLNLSDALVAQAQEDTDKFNSVGRTQGLQTNSASHFDKNHLLGGQRTLRLRYQDALRQFNTDTTIPLVEADPFTGGSNRDDAIPNPEFTKGKLLMPTGVALLLYRFGQICHTIEDFYSHSNWVELASNNIIGKDSLFLTGLDLPKILYPGDFIPGTQVLITGRDGWDDSLKVVGRDTFEISTNEFATRDVYFTVNSDIDPEDGGGVISATTRDGKTVYGLVSGGVAESIWKDADYNPFLRDPKKTAWYQKKYFEGFGHGGFIVGNGPGQRLGPLNKDSPSNKNFQTAQRLANLQVRHEWDRLGNLIYKNYGKAGLERLANAALAPEYRNQYIRTYSVPGGQWVYQSSFNDEPTAFSSNYSSAATNVLDLASNIQTSKDNAPLDGYEGVVSGMNNWLASVDSNRYMSDIGIVQTHNSMAYKPPSGWPSALDYTAFGWGLLNQKGYNLLSQFNGGVRSFSLLTSSKSVENQSEFSFVHGGYPVGDMSDEAFRQLFTALANNPSEFISFSIKPYGGGDGAVEFNKNNSAVPTAGPQEQSKFWSSTPGKRIHSFFFQDGYALQGTPRVWDDSIFSQWQIDIPEEKKALLRGKPLFYIPSAGQQKPAVPKLEELRGKFALQDESWFALPYLDSNGILEMADIALKPDYLKQYYPQYAGDFPYGITYDRGNYRRDEGQDKGHGHYYIYNSRWHVANFIDNFANKPKGSGKAYSPAWLGAVEGEGRNLYEGIGSGLLFSHDTWWNVGGYNGDNGSPSVADVILKGDIDDGRIKKPAVGTVNATFFTDFGAKPYYGANTFTAYGKSPASIVAEVQPRIEILVANSTRKWPGSIVFDIEIRSNIPGIDLASYGILIGNLSGSKRRPINLTGSEIDPTTSSIVAYNNGSRFLSVAVPKDYPTMYTYMTVQAKNLTTGKLFGAPKIVESPPIMNADIPPIRGVRLFAPLIAPLANSDIAQQQELTPALAMSSPDLSARDALQFMDDTGQWIDTDFVDISYHQEFHGEELARLKTPSNKQRRERGERALWVEDLNSFDDHRTQVFKVDAFNSDVPVYIKDFDLSHDRIVLVNPNGQEQSFSDELYQPLSIKRLAKELEAYNVFINYRPLSEYAPKLFILSAEQLSSPLIVDASSFADDISGSSLLFSGFDGSIPFLKLENGRLVADNIDPAYFGQSYTGYVSISNGSSIATDIKITIALDPKLVINGDPYYSRSTFSFDLIESERTFTIYSSHGNYDVVNRYLPIASSIGMASGAPAGFNDSKYQYYLGDHDDYGAVSFWIDTESGNLEQLDINTVSNGIYSLSLNGELVAELRSLDSIGTSTSINAISCNDSLFDGLGLHLGRIDRNLRATNGDLPWRVTLSVDLYREASYSSVVGLYLFDKQSGSVVDPVTGQRFQNNNPEWFKEAERLAVWSGSVGNMSISSQDVVFNINGLIDPDSLALLPYIKVDNSGSSVYYSSFGSLNPDSVSHVKSLSSAAFGFEDMGGAFSDGDFDDVVMNVRSLVLT